MNGWMRSFAILVFLGAACPVSAQTDEDNARALKHFRDGSAFVDQADFEHAYSEFKEGYALSNKPLFLFNMAQCSRELDENDRAVKEYETYLALDPDGKMAADAKATLRVLKPKATVEEPPKPNPPPNLKVPEPKATLPPAETQVPKAAVAPSKPFYKKAPFWIVVGGVVVTAVIVGVVLGTRSGDPQTCELPECWDMRMLP